MSASLAVFLVGLVLFIIPLRVSIASVVGSVTFIAFAAYLITNFLPTLYPSCPYKTPLSQYIFLFIPISRTISPSNGSSVWFLNTSRPQLRKTSHSHTQGRRNCSCEAVCRLKRMYTLCPGYITCHPIPAYRALSYSQQVLYRSLL